VFVCAFVAAVVASAAMVPALRAADWDFSALAHVDALTRLGVAARALDPGFHTVHRGAYDGQYYWGVAVDPLAAGSVHALFDKPSYRYGHPLYGWLGWLFSAGVARAAPAALAAVGLASMVVAAAAASLLGLGRRTSGWEGLFVALNVGLIGAAAHDLGEPLAAAVLLCGILAYVRGSHRSAWICFALLPFAKEPLLLVPIAVVTWEFAHHRRRSAALLALTPVPALFWWTYVRIHLGAWFTSGDTALGSPLSGWGRALFHVGASGWAVSILVALLVLLSLAALRAFRVRGPLELAFVALAALALCLAPNATLAFTTALRNTAFLVVLLPFVLVPPSLKPHGTNGGTKWWRERC
jgi:hypothetical protein